MYRVGNKNCPLCLHVPSHTTDNIFHCKVENLKHQRNSGFPSRPYGAPGPCPNFLNFQLCIERFLSQLHQNSTPLHLNSTPTPEALPRPHHHLTNFKPTSQIVCLRQKSRDWEKYNELDRLKM